MDYKKKSIVLSILFILFIQILLLINNNQKTSFRYFIWDVDEISIGRLIFISFSSGLLMSSLLEKTIHNDIGTFQKNEKDTNTVTENPNSLNSEDNDESYEIPPERDLRDTQPTISVNYRVIKDNDEKEIKYRYQTSKKSQDMDDWNNIDSEW